MLETELEVTETIEEAILEVGIAAADGLRILTAFNTDGGRPAIRLEPGIHELRAELEPALLPGEFVLDLGVHDTPTVRRSTSWSACSSSTSAPRR